MKLRIKPFYNRSGVQIIHRSFEQTSDLGMALTDTTLYTVDGYFQSAGAAEKKKAELSSKALIEVSYLFATDGQYSASVGDLLSIGGTYYEIVSYKNALASYADFTTFYLKLHQE